MAKASTKPTKSTKAAKVVEEVEEVEETETAAAPVFGVADIVSLIETKLGQKTTTRELRTLLRKMARDGRLDREIVAGNRARWEWSGPNDPEVKAVLKAFKDGELEADKQEKLAALKERKAAQRAAEAAAKEEAEEETPAPAKKKPAKKAAAVVEAEDEDIELDEDED